MSDEKEKQFNIYEKVASVSSKLPMFGKANEVLTNSGKKMYAYVDLPQINATLKPLLASNKLGLFHSVFEGKVVTTAVDLESGSMQVSQIHSEIPINTSIKPQDVGSAITYWKRYNTCAIFNIDLADEDNDLAQQYNESLKPKLSFEDKFLFIAKAVAKMSTDSRQKFEDYCGKEFGTATLDKMLEEHIDTLYSVMKGKAK